MNGAVVQRSPRAFALRRLEVALHGDGVQALEQGLARDSTSVALVPGLLAQRVEAGTGLVVAAWQQQRHRDRLLRVT